MAFYADIYGYISVPRNNRIQDEIVRAITNESPIFKLEQLNVVDGRALSLVPFACEAKIDLNEIELWINPFERLLRQIQFVYATVHILNEEGHKSRMYYYEHVGDHIRRSVRELDEVVLEERML